MTTDVIENDLSELLLAVMQAVRPATHYFVQCDTTQEYRNHFPLRSGQPGSNDRIVGASWHIGYVPDEPEPFNVEVYLDTDHRGLRLGGKPGITVYYEYVGVTGQFISKGAPSWLQVDSPDRLANVLVSVLTRAQETFESRHA